ncbi:4'-phosphopantetheinyl transferase family protein [Paenibacillus wynnii]|uniref:4'-phosphopantetheinyl transferase family protein n=1 Tax=Paenibacillus wynnii TaxID=268407 RepID=UPI00278ECB46|nr:4'-phosphopantetheinyl transferase superfamily protein [Paenibacillus wynnii]MDQ0191716.1 4'-phosphopantetheinyl transferase [Paenibacillus wynnii]
MKVNSAYVGAYMDAITFEALWKRLSKEKQERLKKFKRQQDIVRSLVADLLARTMCAEALSCSMEDVEFEYNEFGKPLVSGDTPCYFNVSHSGDWVVCAVDSDAIGIDIEQKSDIDLEIARRFFTSQEYRYIFGGDPITRKDRFYEIWTFKESYIKAVGKGLSIPLQSFEVQIEKQEYGESLLARIDRNSSSDNVWFLKQFNMNADYKVAICAKERLFTQTIHNIDINRLSL